MGLEKLKKVYKRIATVMLISAGFFIVPCSLEISGGRHPNLIILICSFLALCFCILSAYFYEKAEKL